MDAVIPLIALHFLIVMGPALWMTAKLIRRIPAENTRDRRLLVESKLARLPEIAAGASVDRAA